MSNIFQIYRLSSFRVFLNSFFLLFQSYCQNYSTATAYLDYVTFKGNTSSYLSLCNLSRSLTLEAQALVSVKNKFLYSKIV